MLKRRPDFWQIPGRHPATFSMKQMTFAEAAKPGRVDY
jgi:hypothetical protein